MPLVKVTQNNFTAGELAPELHERYDFVKYNSGLDTCENFILRRQGGLFKRPGARYVAHSKGVGTARLVPFIFNVTQANVLEFGNLYVRIFGSNAQIMDSGSPVEVVTPYTAAQVFDLQFAQDADTLYIVHSSHAPRKLVRLSATSWQLRTVAFTPPPSVVTPLQPNTTLTLSALTGTGITLTTADDAFLETDVDRLVTEAASLGNGVAVITDVTSTATATADVVSDFSALSFTTGNWALEGSPVAQLKPEKARPIGARTKLTLQRVQADATELVTNGDFADGLTSWTDLSGPTVTTGTCTAGSNDTTLVASGDTFQSDGVQANHRAVNDTDTTNVAVVSVDSETQLTTEAGGAWTDTDTYTIRQSGTATATGGAINLNGGANGVASIEQSVTVEDGITYRLTFDVTTQPLSVQIGKTSGASDITAEATYDIGNEQEVLFTADGTSAFIQFRNNQNATATVDNASVKKFDIDGWRTSDVGSFVKVNSGIVEIVSYTNRSEVIGIIRKELDDALAALAGAWTLETSAWGDSNGWPAVITFFGERLFMGATNTYPMRLWGSETFLFESFGVGANASDAVDFQPSAGEVNRFRWIAGERALIAATSREEFIIRGSLSNTLKPNDIDVDSPTHIGAEPIQPERVQRGLLYVTREGVEVGEFAYSAEADDRDVDELSILANHLFTSGIRSIAYQQEPEPILWVVTKDDKLHSLTYHRRQDVIGWVTHPMQGDVLDATVIPHPDGDRDQVWLMVDRNTGQPPYVEYLDDGAGHYGQLLTDSATVATFATAATAITGLSHLEGMSVAVLGDGAVQASKTVSGGAITADTAAKAFEVGFNYTAKGVTLRPVIDGNPAALIGLRMSNATTYVSVLNTASFKVNNDQLEFTTGNIDKFDTATGLATGLHRVTLVGTSLDAGVTFEQDLPLPLHMRAVVRSVEVANV